MRTIWVLLHILPVVTAFLFVLDIPVKKLAPLLGKKEDAVYKLINRARERLAKELEKEGIEI